MHIFFKDKTETYRGWVTYQGHRSIKGQSQDFNPILSDSEAYNPICYVEHHNLRK